MTTAPEAISHVFIVRIWYEAPEALEREMRMQVRSIPTGETRYFLDWTALAAFVTGKLEGGSSNQEK